MDDLAQNIISSSVGGSDYLPQISSNCVQYSCEAKQKCQRWHGTDIKATGHSENVIDSAAQKDTKLQYKQCRSFIVRHLCNDYLPARSTKCTLL